MQRIKSALKNKLADFLGVGIVDVEAKSHRSLPIPIANISSSGSSRGHLQAIRRHQYHLFVDIG